MSKNQLIFLAIVVLVTVGGAYRQGILTDRWSNEVSERLQTFTNHLDGVPKQIGNWVSEDTPVNEDQWKASNCHGRISRVYQNTATGDVVNVFLVSGKGYHVTIHSPDWCYVAAGYEMDKDPDTFSFDVPSVPAPEFLNAMFKRVTPTETRQIRILWGYSDDGKWTSPKLAKYSFASKPALYKVYLISEIRDGVVPNLTEDPTVNFAREFLPTVNNILFPSAGAAETEPTEVAKL